MLIYLRRSITVFIEFQKIQQQLKVYFDIDENASFSDLQLVVSSTLSSIDPHNYSLFLEFSHCDRNSYPFSV